MTQVIHDLSSLRHIIPPGDHLVATIGFFDGVHTAHQALISATCHMARRMGARSLVITPDIHPLTLVHPTMERPRLLTPLPEKLQLIKALAPDYIAILHFTEEERQRSASDFVRPLLESGLVGLSLGYDNRFGHRTSGESLADFDHQLRAMGIRVERLSIVEREGHVVSSTAIRRALEARDMELATLLLGRPYSITGTVEHGRQIGRTIQYPTANVHPASADVALPPVGIYVASVVVDGIEYAAMAYYGHAPTVTGNDEGQRRRIEAFLLQFDGELYGKSIQVRFVHFIRDDKTFESLAALATQLEEDRRYTEHYFAQHPIGQ